MSRSSANRDSKEPVKIVLVDYDPAWPSRFDDECRRISAALQGAARRIEHIGSTAVPGLAAKPVIDILVATDHVEDEAAYAPAFKSAGYKLRVREPDHRMFRTVAKDVHVHVWSADSAEIDRHLRFRDWLRSNEEDRRLYETVKRELAARPWRDSNDYAQAKSAVIADIVGRASASR